MLAQGAAAGACCLTAERRGQGPGIGGLGLERGLQVAVTASFGGELRRAPGVKHPEARVKGGAGFLPGRVELRPPIQQEQAGEESPWIARHGPRS